MAVNLKDLLKKTQPLHPTEVEDKRAARAIDRERVEYGSRLTDLALLSESRVTYSVNLLPWLLLGCLYVFTSTTVKRQVSVHPDVGIMLLVLGFYIGIFFDKNIGCLLIKYGKGPFETTILRVYKNHTWAVLGLSLAVVFVQFVLANLTGGAHGYKSSLHVLFWMHFHSWLELGFI